MVAIAVAGMLAGGIVQAQEVLKAKGCLGCHDMDKKIVDPSFKDIAVKYKGKKDAKSALVAKLRDGKGHPKMAAPEADLKAAVGQAPATK